MTEGTTLTAMAPPIAAAIAGGVLRLVPPTRGQDRANTVCALLVSGIAVVAAVTALLATSVDPAARSGAWVALDPLAGVFLLVIATVGLGSALVSPAYLQTGHGGFFRGGAPTAGTTSASTSSGPSCWPSPSSATWASPG